MRILHLHRDLPPDSRSGVAIQVHRLASAQAALGEEVAVCGDSRAPAGAPYQALPAPGDTLKALTARAPFTKRIGYPWRLRAIDPTGWDVVHVHGDGAFLPAGPRVFRSFYGTAALEARYARRWKDKVAQRISYAMERKEVGKFRHLSVIAPHIRAYLRGDARVLPCAVSSEPPPLDFAAKSPKPSWLYVGSLGGRKRGETALTIAGRLLQRHPDWEFHFVGGRDAALEREIQRRGEGWHFHVSPDEEELNALYARCWAHVCLSAYEGFGVPSWEAMARGCASLSTPHAGALDWIKPLQAGILEELPVLETRLEALLTQPEACREWGAAGHRASHRFSPGRIAQEALEWYRQAG